MHVQKKHQKYLGETKPNHRVASLLSESERAIREGNARDAYELSLKATQSAPENIDAWLLRAALAPSLEEKIICINHLNEMGADGYDRHHIAFFTIKETLDNDPFLAYLEETDSLYRVLHGSHLVLSIPKKRSTVNSSPFEQPNPLKAAYRWLLMAMIGLMLAGLGTLIFAPLAVWSAFRAERSLESYADRVSSLIVLILSLILFLIGTFFSVLFLLHLTG